MLCVLFHCRPINALLFSSIDYLAFIWYTAMLQLLRTDTGIVYLPYPNLMCCLHQGEGLALHDDAIEPNIAISSNHKRNATLCFRKIQYRLRDLVHCEMVATTIWLITPIMRMQSIL